MRDEFFRKVPSMRDKFNHFYPSLRDFCISLLTNEFVSFAPHALKGQKLLAQGIALGYHGANLSPCKGKSFKIPGNL